VTRSRSRLPPLRTSRAELAGGLVAERVVSDARLAQGELGAQALDDAVGALDLLRSQHIGCAYVQHEQAQQLLLRGGHGPGISLRVHRRGRDADFLGARMQ
jgi:hypothetical protein